MAFIRSYRRMGDPLGAPLIRAGFIHAPRRFQPRRGPGITLQQGRFFTPSHPGGYKRTQLVLGDPFLGKLFKKAGKALKKVTLKGVVKGVANVARMAAPVLLPGVGGLIAGAVLGRGGGAASAEEAAPQVLEAAAPAAAPLDQETLRALVEQYLAEQQAQQMAAYQAAVAQAQMMQSLQSPSFAPGAWGF